MREGSRTLRPFFHMYTAADAKIGAEVAAVITSQLKSGLGNCGFWGRRKKLEVPVAVAKLENVDRCTPVADWGQGSTTVTADPVRGETFAKEG